MYIAIEGNMCIQSDTKAGLTYRLPLKAKLVVEKEGDSLVAYVHCTVWMNKKVRLQEYSTDWAEYEIRNDIAVRLFSKFGMTLNRLVEL